MSSASPAASSPLQQLAKDLAHLGAELLTEGAPDEVEEYVSVPTGFRQAIEVYVTAITVRMVGEDGTPEPDPWLYAVARSWDATGGVDSEVELCAMPASVAGSMVSALVAQAERAEVELSEMMTPEAEKPGSAERIGRLRAMLVESDPAGEYRRGLFDAYCAVTGEEPEAVVEWLAEAAQARHDRES